MKFTSFLCRVRGHPNAPDLVRFWALDKPKTSSIRKYLGKYMPVEPVLPEHVALLRRHLDVEYNVMRCLSSPYISKEKEDIFHAKYGLPHENAAKEEERAEYERMPNKPKVVSGRSRYDNRRGNVGNLLHEPQTVEKHFAHLVLSRRFE